MDSIKPYVQLLLPGTCYDTFLVDLNFLDAQCLKVFISKVLSYSIMLGAILVKLPQILKIFGAKSGKGLSLTSLYLELVAITATVSYGINSQFPFSVYGDGAFLLIQTILIVIMVLLYSGETMTCLLYMAIHGSILGYLFSGMAPFDLVWGLQSASVPVIAVSKLMQVVANYQNGSTGQLSSITVALLFLGSAAKIFTSFQETGDTTLIVSYSVAAVCNGTILAQVIMYWNVDSVDKKKKAA